MGYDPVALTACHTVQVNKTIIKIGGIKLRFRIFIFNKYVWSFFVKFYSDILNMCVITRHTYNR